MYDVLRWHKATMSRNRCILVQLEVGLLQMRDEMNYPLYVAPYNTILRPSTFASKSLSSVGRSFTHIERETLGMQNGLEKFHHYYFSKEISIITDIKPPAAIFKKDAAELSQRL